MSIRLSAQVTSRAEPERVWRELTDWAGQSRWIPLTAVRVPGRRSGIGVRAEALSGVWCGRIPLGLLDRFVVTAWTPPGSGVEGRGAGELEVLHLGPYFTGEGVFRVQPEAEGTSITCTEVFALPGGAPVEAVARLGLPLMQRGLVMSLHGLARVSEEQADQTPPGVPRWGGKR